MSARGKNLLTKPERDGKIEVPAGAGRNLEN